MQHFLAAVAYLRGVNLRGFSNPTHPHFHGQLNDNFWHPPGRAESCGANMPQARTPAYETPGYGHL